MPLCAHSPFSLFIWLHRAAHICSFAAVLVNYAICVSCHSRHQLAPLSRLHIWNASNLVLCCWEHDVNLSWLDWKGGNVPTLGSLLTVHLGLLNQEWIPGVLCFLITGWKWYSSPLLDYLQTVQCDGGKLKKKDILSGDAPGFFLDHTTPVWSNTLFVQVW